jgi:hypothetical protein
MADLRWEHAAEARAALNAIVTDPEHGASALSSPRTMSNLLKDLLPDAPREKSLLIAAADAGLADTLREHVSQGMDTPTAIRLTASSFSASTPLSPDACNWVTSEIAMALGISSPVILAKQGESHEQGAGHPSEAPTRDYVRPPAARGVDPAAVEGAGQEPARGFGQVAGVPSSSDPGYGQPSNQPSYQPSNPQSYQPSNPQSYQPSNPQGPAAGLQEPGSYPQAAFPNTAFQQPGYPQSGYQQPGYPQPLGQGVPVPPGTGYSRPPTNSLAVAALVCGIVQFFGLWLLGTIPAIVVGHMARKQVRQRNEQGAGMALAGLILGYVGLALTVIFVIIIIIVAVHSNSSTNY